MRKFFTIYASCLLLTTMVFAQEVKITGTVTDQQSGDPLIGANVIIKGTSRGSITDVEGTYARVHSQNMVESSSPFQI